MALTFIPTANTPMAMGVNYGARPPIIPRANTPMAMGINYALPHPTALPPASGILPGPHAPPVDPWLALYKQAMGMIETPAQADARIKQEIADEMAAQQKLINDTYARQRADALAAMNAQSAAGAAAAAMSKGLLSSVGGEYNAAAGEISGLAGGLTSAFNKTTAQEVKKANAALGNLGAPAVQVGGLGGIGGAQQAAVEKFRGGTIPSQLFSEEGDAATFGLAGQTAAENLKITQEAQASYQSTVHDINTAEMNAMQALAANEPTLAHQYLQEANDARVKAITLASGLLSAKQAMQQSALTARVNALKLQQAQQRINQQGAYQAGSLRVRAAAITAQNARAQASIRAQNARAAAGITSRQDIARWGITSREKIAALKATQTQLTQMRAAGQIDVNRSRALGYVVTKSGQKVLDASGHVIPSWRLSTPKTMTPGQLQRISQTAENKAMEYFFGTTVDPKTKKLVPASTIAGFDPTNASTWGQNRVGYTTALRNLMRLKVPEDGARAALNAIYQRGDMGRPFFSQGEKTAILRAYMRKYGLRSQALQHFQGLLNSLNRYLGMNKPEGDAMFERLIQQNLSLAGL